MSADPATRALFEAPQANHWRALEVAVEMAKGEGAAKTLEALAVCVGTAHAFDAVLDQAFGAVAAPPAPPVPVPAPSPPAPLPQPPVLPAPVPGLPGSLLRFGAFEVHTLKGIEALVSRKTVSVSVTNTDATAKQIGDSHAWITRDTRQACVVEGRSLNLCVSLNTAEWDKAANAPLHSLAETAAGRLDADWRRLFKGLKTAGYTVIRLIPGKEGNGGWYYYGAARWSGPTLLDFSADFVASSVRCVDIFREVFSPAQFPGCDVAFSPTIGKEVMNWQKIMPPRTHWDVLFPTFYFKNWNPLYNTLPRNIADPANDPHWQKQLLNGPEGLAEYEAVARKLGVGFGFLEAGGGRDYRYVNDLGKTQSTPRSIVNGVAGWPAQVVPDTRDVLGGDNPVPWTNVLRRAKADPKLYTEEIIPWQKGILVRTAADGSKTAFWNADCRLDDPNSPKPLMKAAFLAEIA